MDNNTFEKTFDRVDAKFKSKDQLRGKLGWFAPSAFVSLICGILTEAINFHENNNIFSQSLEASSSPNPLLSLIQLICVIIMAVISVNIAHIALAVAKGEERPRPFEAFSDNELGRSCLSAFRVYIFSVLWSFLLIIPGIIKSLAYSFTYFITKDNPSFTAGEAQKESIEITRGVKGKLFVTGITFIPWCCIIFIPVIGFFVYAFWLLPYMTTTYANAYLQVKTSQNTVINLNSGTTSNNNSNRNDNQELIEE